MVFQLLNTLFSGQKSTKFLEVLLDYVHCLEQHYNQRKIKMTQIGLQSIKN